MLALDVKLVLMFPILSHVLISIAPVSVMPNLLKVSAETDAHVDTWKFDIVIPESNSKK